MRKKFLFILAIVSMVAAACGGGSSNAVEGCPDIPSADGVSEDNDVTVALVYDIGGRGDQSFNDSAACGIETAANALGIEFSEASPNADGSNRGELLQLGADNADMVIGVGFLFEGDVATVGGANADTDFAVVDSGMLDFANGAVPYGDNIGCLLYTSPSPRDQRGSRMPSSA